MLKRLIVSADDFGLTKGVNRGIVKAFQEGIVTSASLLSVGQAYDDAISLAKRNPGLDIGIHLCLTEEKPILEKEIIPSLTVRSGRFLETHGKFILNYILRRVDLNDVEKEIDAQIKRIIDSGIPLTHMDSHGHIHMLPHILAVAVKLAKKYNIRIIRYPREKISFCDFKWQRYAAFCFLGLACLLTKFNQEYKRFIKIDYFFGFFNSGQLSLESVRKILSIFSSGVGELSCHPGEYDAAHQRYNCWKYNWQRELKALTSNDMKMAIEEANIELINFRGLV